MGKYAKKSSMNIFIITEEDPFYLYEFFRMFYADAANASYVIAGAAILKTFNKQSSIALARQMYDFFGPLHFFSMSFAWLLHRVTGHTVASITVRNHIPLIDTVSVNSPEFIAEIKRRNIDVIVSVAAPQRFKKELITAVSGGCINSHSSLLPENRGMMPVFWALYKGAPVTGVTIHYINEKLDNGDIIAQEKVPVGNETMHEMILKTKRISARLMDQALRNIAAGSVIARQMPTGGSYQSFPTRQEVREFRSRGKRII
jgi:methionyl-tRNA formyltransferase